jgi:hypothetical protein
MDDTQTVERPQLPSLSSFRTVEDVIVAFDQHLERQRGCTEGTWDHYRREARAFLVRVLPDQQINWGNITARQMADFVSNRRRNSP